MPISKQVLFVCEMCNYKKVYTIGDNLTPNDLIKVCPKCGENMKRRDIIENTLTSFFKRILGK